jgi:carboxymethylenebutenolidase
VSERQGSEIRFGEGSTGYRAIPASGSGPGVVVLHEASGLSDFIRDACDRLAREGFVALAPDLYHGEFGGDHDSAGRLMLELDLPKARAEIDAAVMALLGDDAVDGSRIGCLGFCMGGMLALYAATSNARIGAVADCYGVHPNVVLDLEGLEAPVLGIFGELDAYVPIDGVRELEADLKAAGKSAHFCVHLGVQHAFMNDARPDVYDAPTAGEAWSEVLSFLRAELR